MPKRSPLKILQAFNALKRKRESMPYDQYVKELHVLKAELNVHLEEPRMTLEESNELNALLRRKPI
ncbi:hypothetical protein LCGC14_1215650 [marine sediment metagenome]|uniref:Uncharacterized protein n=2 Tax=root TaxID=1 RepID=A0A831VPT3_9FLAO|nr:hypothetical protein [Pricia antarctica]